MLAPLKDRSLIERDSDDRSEAELRADNAALKVRLRQARQMQKRTATLSTRKIIELTNENLRLSELNRYQQKRLEELESGAAIVALGQQLMATRLHNEELLDAAKCVWFLDRTLCAARSECERLARERDNALDTLHLRSEQRFGA